MSKVPLITVACALGALLTQSSFAAGAPRATPAGNVVPVSIVPPILHEREVDAAATPPVPRQDARPATRGAAQPSALDREIGTASDGGYVYYGSEAR